MDRRHCEPQAKQPRGRRARNLGSAPPAGTPLGAASPSARNDGALPIYPSRSSCAGTVGGAGSGAPSAFSPRATIRSCASGRRPLQRPRLGPGRAQPHVVLLEARQQHRHRLRMHGTDNAVRRRGEKAEERMLAVDRRGLRPARAVPRRPQAREGAERAALVEREPGRNLPRLGVGPFAERGQRDQDAASPARASAASAGLSGLRMLVTGAPPNCGGPGMPQRIISRRRAAVGDAHDRRHLVGEDVGQRRQVAGQILAGSRRAGASHPATA